MAVHELETDDAASFYHDLSKSDSLSVTIKGAIYVDQQIDRLLRAISVDPDFFERIDLTYLQRVQLAIAFGLPRRFLAPLKSLGEIRNKFAHVIRGEITSADMDGFYNTFDGAEKNLIQTMYAQMNKQRVDGVKRPKRMANLDPLERFQLYVTTLRSALVVANHEVLQHDADDQIGTPR